MGVEVIHFMQQLAIASTIVIIWSLLLIILFLRRTEQSGYGSGLLIFPVVSIASWAVWFSIVMHPAKLDTKGLDIC